MAGEVKAFRVLFPKRHIPIILISILQAGKTLRKKSPNEIENRLTRRLCKKLNQIRIFRDGPLSIHSQQEILSSDPDKDTPEGYIDILVSCEFGSEVYFAIEAKRLRVRSISGKMDAGNDDYVNDGMMRFISGQYAPFMRTGAMLGYVYDRDINKARSGVAGYIKGRGKELKLISPKQFTRASILPDKAIYETRHALQKRSFIIYHIFLAV